MEIIYDSYYISSVAQMDDTVLLNHHLKASVEQPVKCTFVKIEKTRLKFSR